MSMLRVAPALVVLLLSASTLPAQIKNDAHTRAGGGHPTIYVDIKGRNNQQFPGDATTGPRKNQIVALALEYETAIPRNPLTGLETGRRMHKPVVITHDVGPATPYIYDAAVANERLTVTIEVGKADANGLITPSYTLVLTNAAVTSVRQFTEDRCVDAGCLRIDNILVEEVALTFQKLEMKVGTKTAMDDWTPSM